MSLTILPVLGLPEIQPGDDLARAVLDRFDIAAGDVVVVSQKIVSKAEGALVDPSAMAPGGDPRRELARTIAADIVADAPWALIVRTDHGLVCANAGIDASNVAGGMLALLPEDPDASARRLRDEIAASAGVDVAVIVADTFGRPWRLGQVDVAIGVAGLAPLRDERGGADRNGNVLTVTEIAIADELAAAADLVRTKSDGVPVVVVRGFTWDPDEQARATDLVRPAETDLFAKGRGMLPAQLRTAWPDVQPLDASDIAAVHEVTATARVVETGPPTVVAVDDAFDGGLAAAVLVDRGAYVRWHRQGDGIVVESGRAVRDR